MCHLFMMMLLGAGAKPHAPLQPPNLTSCSLSINGVDHSVRISQVIVWLILSNKNRNMCSVQSLAHCGCVILGDCGRRKAAELEQRTKCKFSRPSINIYQMSRGGRLLCRILPRLSKFFSHKFSLRYFMS